MLLYSYISRFSVNPHYQQQLYLRPPLVAFSTSRTNGPRSLLQAKAGTHSALLKGSHTSAYTPKHGCFRWGWYHYPRSVPHVHKQPRPGYQNGKLCRFWVLVGRCSRRTQKAFGTAMRLCASLFRGVAAPLGRVIFLLLSKLRLVRPAFSTFRMYGAGVVSLPSARFACC